MLSRRIVMLLTASFLAGCTLAQPQTAAPQVNPVAVVSTITPSPANPTHTPSPIPWVAQLTRTTLTPIPSATEEAPTPVSVPSFSHTYTNGLTVEEYELKAAPQIEPLVFDPVQGSQASILAKHQGERRQFLVGRTEYGTDTRVYPATGGDQYLAKQVYTDIGGQLKVSVEIVKDGKIIYAAPAGDNSPLDSVRGLWIYAGHWAMEYAYVTTTKVNPLEITLTKVGQIVEDGVSLNQRDGLQEAFGFQLLKGKPFYFSTKNNQIGISYDGEMLPLMYDEIPHYGCCSASALNPIQAKNIIAFFARRDATWYYVEIGRYDWVGSIPIDGLSL